MGTTYKYFEDLASTTMKDRNGETKLFLKQLEHIENQKLYRHLVHKLKERNND